MKLLWEMQAFCANVSGILIGHSQTEENIIFSSQYLGFNLLGFSAIMLECTVSSTQFRPQMSYLQGALICS